MRSAPKNGYDFGNKRQYRRDVWRFFQKNCPVPRSEAQAFLMPSLEGDEIDVALNNGFREQNLHVLDRNPAIVATLKRRYPRVNTYGVEVFRAFTERIPPHTIHVANVDLTGILGRSWNATCYAVGRSLAPNGLIAATYLKGRDPHIAALMKPCGAVDRETAIVRYFNAAAQEKLRSGTASEELERDLAMLMEGRDKVYDSRHAIADSVMFIDPAVRRVGAYRSGTITMEWIAGRTRLALPSLPINFKRDQALARRGSDHLRALCADHYYKALRIRTYALVLAGLSLSSEMIEALGVAKIIEKERRVSPSFGSVGDLVDCDQR